MIKSFSNRQISIKYYDDREISIKLQFWIKDWLFGYMKSESFSLIEKFISTANFGVLVLILTSESGNSEFDWKRHYFAKMIRFHSCFGCPKMNYYLNNMFVLTALDMGKGPSSWWSARRRRSRSKGTGTRGRWWRPSSRWSVRRMLWRLSGLPQMPDHADSSPKLLIDQSFLESKINDFQHYTLLKIFYSRKKIILIYWLCQDGPL